MGLGTQVLCDLVRRNDFDLVFIMEIKSIVSRMEKHKLMLGFDGFLVVDVRVEVGKLLCFGVGLLIYSFLPTLSITLMLKLWMLVGVANGGL